MTGPPAEVLCPSLLASFAKLLLRCRMFNVWKIQHQETAIPLVYHSRNEKALSVERNGMLDYASCSEYVLSAIFLTGFPQ
jgi:hypothetical protein